ncbi:MAG TPA: hypothetical protein PK648_00550 [Verrucomicrobiales bacterium]|jgi:hypothetical protein|nr:hypothetical protein [Verrucomicrobiales bacterium]
MNRLTTPHPSSNNHSTTAFLQDQIESTRQSIDEILARIADRLDPRSLFADITNLFVNRSDSFDLEEVKDSVSHSLREVGRKAKENPIPVALGCLVIASLFLPKRSRHGRAEEVLDEVAEEVDDAKRKLGRKVRETKESLREAASAGKEAMVERSASARQSLAEFTEAGREKVGALASDAVSKGENHPIGLAVGALAVGFLAALALPSTRKERAVLGDSADRTISRLKASGADLADEARSVLHENHLDPDGLRKRAASLIQRSSRRARHIVDDHLEP